MSILTQSSHLPYSIHILPHLSISFSTSHYTLIIMITYHLSSSIGTHVAGTVAGNDPSATIGEGAVYDGVAPDAKIAFTDMAEGNSQGLGVRSIVVMNSRMPYGGGDDDEYSNMTSAFLLFCSFYSYTPYLPSPSPSPFSRYTNPPITLLIRSLIVLRTCIALHMLLVPAFIPILGVVNIKVEAVTAMRIVTDGSMRTPTIL